MVYFQFSWRIENFSYFWKIISGVKFYSPEFLLTTDVKTKWRILITDEKPTKHSRSQIPINKDFIKVYLARIEDDGILDLNLHTEVELLQVDGSLFRPHKLGISNTYFKGTNTCILHENIKFVYSIAEIVPKDVLIIRCKIWSTSLSFLEKGKCIAKTRASVETMHFIAEFRITSVIINNLESGEGIIAKIQCVSTPEPSFTVLMFENILLWVIGHNLAHLGFCRVLILDNFNNWEECGQYSQWRELKTDCVFPLTLSFKTVMDSKQQYLRHDLMTLKFEVAFYSKPITPKRIDYIKYETVSEKRIEPHKPPRTLKNDLLQLQKEGILCDVKLRAESQTFQAHKAVLSARSPVFKNMFSSNMKENTSGFVDILDMCADTLRILLKFIYTDSTGSMRWQDAIDLYFAADKYQIDSLKYKCSVFLKFNIQPSNFCELLLLSDRHQDSKLKQFAQEYMVKWHKSVFRTSEWRTFKDSYFHLAADTMFLIHTSK